MACSRGNHLIRKRKGIISLSLCETSDHSRRLTFCISLFPICSIRFFGLIVLCAVRQGDLLNELHKQGTIQHEDFAAEGTLVAASVPVSLANRLEHLRVDATYFEKQTTGFFRKRAS